LARDIKARYNGYKLDSSGKHSYNPFSIVKCLNNFEEYKNTQMDAHTLKTAILKNYWVDSGNIDFVNDLLRVPVVKSKIDRLIRDEPVYFDIDKQIWSDDLMALKKLIDLGSNYQMDETVTHILFSYLFHAGYLTDLLREKRFKIPNNEIKTVFENKLLNFYKQEYRIDTCFFTDFSDQLKKTIECDDQIRFFSLDSVRSLLKELLKFEKIKDEKADKAFNNKTDFRDDLLSYIALNLNFLSKYNSEVHLGQGIAHVIIINDLNKTGSVIKIGYDKEAYVEQNKTEEYANKLAQQMETDVISLIVKEGSSIDIICTHKAKGKICYQF
jgi:hypothetical protein